jgi:multidrug efflux pump
MALTIAAGFVVDDAIVMIENIVRYIEAGEAPLPAALKGARQIGFTIVSLTISLVAVFIPLLLMGGIVGRLFREFAITLSLAVIVSGFVSLTLTPMMCAVLLRGHEEERKPNLLFRISERGFDALAAVYLRGLDWVLRRQLLTLIGFFATLAATIFLAAMVQKGFLPQQDTGLLVGTTDAPQDISFTAMAQRQRAIADAIAADPDVVTIDSFVGAGTVNATLNSGRLYIDISSPDHRAAAPAVMERLRKAAEKVDGISLHLQAAQDLAIETRTSRTQYQYVLQDLDEVELQVWSSRLVAAMQLEPALADVASDRQDEGLRMTIAVDRQAAARMGVTMNDIDQTLYDAFGQRQIATVYSPLTQYHVILEVDPRYRRDPAVLGKIYVTSASSQTSTDSDAASGISSGFHQASAAIPLAAFAHMERRLAPLAITHEGLFPSTTISFNLAPGAALGEAVTALHEAERRIGLPDTVATNLAGAAAEFASSLHSEGVLVLAALVTVYIVLGVLYESFIHPITILSTLPSAGVGAFAALMMLGMELDLVSLIGLVLLIGIVKKNAIMMVDFALEAQRVQGLAPLAAIRTACILRFRPIMMTTMAALLGALPLAVGTGTGSELRRPLGVAIVGGLIVSQILTLYTTPVIYLAFDRLQQRWSFGRRAVS